MPNNSKKPNRGRTGENGLIKYGLFKARIVYGLHCKIIKKDGEKCRHTRDRKNIACRPHYAALPNWIKRLLWYQETEDTKLPNPKGMAAAMRWWKKHG